MYRRSVQDSGFSLIDLLVTVAVLATVAAIAIPTMGRTVDMMRLRMAARSVERELQSARMHAVSANRPMRVRFNCPSAGEFRVVELIGTPRTPDAADDTNTRCSEAAFPYPAPDRDPLTRPNADGPLRRLPPGVRFGDVQSVEFWPNGTVRVDANAGAPWPPVPAEGLTLSMLKDTATRSITVTRLGKIRIQ